MKRIQTLIRQKNISAEQIERVMLYSLIFFMAFSAASQLATVL